MAARPKPASALPSAIQTLQPRDEIESTGLGLALVKKLVEEEGGKITLESEAGTGARFSFTWPAVAPGEQVAR